MGFDGLLAVVEDGAGFQVGLAHAEGLLHVPQVVVGGDDLACGHETCGNVGHLAFQPGDLHGSLPRGLIERQIPALDSRNEDQQVSGGGCALSCLFFY